MCFFFFPGKKSYDYTERGGKDIGFEQEFSKKGVKGPKQMTTKITSLDSGFQQSLRSLKSEKKMQEFTKKIIRVNIR